MAVDAVLANLMAVLTMEARRRRRVVINHWGRGEGEEGDEGGEREGQW